MIVVPASPWDDYELLDSGYGERLERFGAYKLVRPDPQVLWKPQLPDSEWQKADAFFEEKRGWKTRKQIPGKWPLKYKQLSLWAKLSPFKHTGIFPEQSAQWDFIDEILGRTSRYIPSSSDQKDQPNKQLHVLNLFAYTGIASLVAASAGAKVTHVDASKPAIAWAKENQEASGLTEKPIRWILDDAMKFTEREAKRGVTYDGIIMDPPIYGHGPEGEKWDFMNDFPKLVSNCVKILSDAPLFFLINAYAISASAIMLENVLKGEMKQFGGKISCGELVIPESGTDRVLSTGIFGKWEK